MAIRILLLLIKTWRTHHLSPSQTPEEAETLKETVRPTIQRFQNIFMCRRLSMLPAAVLLREVHSLDDTMPSNLLALLQEHMLEASEVVRDAFPPRACLLILLRASLQMGPRTRPGYSRPFDLYFFLWFRTQDDPMREEQMFAHALEECRDMERDSGRGVVSAALGHMITPPEMADVMASMKRHLSNRHETSQKHAGLIELLCYLADDAYGDFFGKQSGRDKFGNPFPFVMKAIQREISARSGNPFEEDLLAFGLEALL